jgi:hypothetical protein
MNDKIAAFLTEPNNLETALEIEAHLQTERKRIFQSFWEIVRDDLQYRLSISDYGIHWAVKLDNNLFNNTYTGLEIAWQAPQFGRQFKVRAECLTSIGKESAYYGIMEKTSSSSGQQSQDEQILLARLVQDRFNSPPYTFFC